MKKYLFFVFLLFFIANISSQNYTPMLEVGKTWNMHHFDNNIPLPSNNYDFNITLDYTTTINGVEYFHASNGMLFREDIATKKVYRFRNDIEELILDFNLNIGDDLTSPLVAIDENSFSKSITSIGTNTFYGVPNLNFYKTDCGEMIIEGIGVSGKGLFDISYHCSTVDFDTGNYMINLNSLATNNYLTQNNINLFFNAEDYTLDLTNSNGFFNLELFSILGKKIVQTQIKDKMHISIKKGIYFYQLSNGESYKKGKILIY